MKAIGKNTFIDEKKVNGAFINQSADSKWSVAFKMQQGESIWSEKQETRELAENIAKIVME